MTEESQGSGAARGDAPLLLANPAAGGGRGRARVSSLSAVLSSWPDPPEIVWSRSFEHLFELAAGAAEQGRSLVVAAGGDGTAHAVVDGLLTVGSSRTPELGYLPVGTSGDFGRSLGLPSDAHAVATGLPEWEAHAIDLGRVRLSDGRLRPFLNAASIGLAPRVVDRVGRSSWLGGLGRLAYPMAAVLEARRACPVEVTVRIDGGEPWRGRVVHLSVANGPCFGGGLRPIAEASLRSGRLHLLRVGEIGAAAAVRELLRALRGLEPRHPSTVIVSARVIELEGRGRVELDGQVPGRLPARFDLAPAALRVRCPAAPARGARPSV